MVGKLWLDLGEDYAFDIRRAKEVAEGAGGAGGGSTANDGIKGPYTRNGTRYWIEKRGNTCWVLFNTDSNPNDPEVRVPVADFLADQSNDPLLRAAVAQKAQALGCG